MRFEVSFKFSFQNLFLSLKIKVKNFQISLAGLHSTPLKFKNGKGNVGGNVGIVFDFTGGTPKCYLLRCFLGRYQFASGI
jgi:hypothetical protein